MLIDDWTRMSEGVGAHPWHGTVPGESNRHRSMTLQCVTRCPSSAKGHGRRESRAGAPTWEGVVLVQGGHGVGCRLVLCVADEAAAARLPRGKVHEQLHADDLQRAGRRFIDMFTAPTCLQHPRVAAPTCHSTHVCPRQPAVGSTVLWQRRQKLTAGVQGGKPTSVTCTAGCALELP